MVSQIQTCYRHPDRRAGVRCQRCDRPICPSCMTQASVGFHCPECARGGQQRVYSGPRAFAPQQPVVTLALIGINVAVFVAGLAQAGSGLLSSVSPFANDYGMIGSGVLVLNLVFTFGVSGISIGGHIGGLIGGYLCGLILYELTPRMKTHPAVPAILCGVLGVACFAASLVVAAGLSP